MKKRALIVLADGFEDIEAVAPIDVLNRVGVEVVVASLKSGAVSAAYGTKIIPSCALAEVSGEFDAIIFPGGKANAVALAQSHEVRGLIHEFIEKGKLVAAICAAPSLVLGESAGVLKGKNATGDSGFTDKLISSGAKAHPGPVCIDGNIITATGPGSALAFGLALASYLVGEEVTKPYYEKWEVGKMASRPIDV